MSTVLPSSKPDSAVKTYQMYYGGQWHDAADGGHFDVHEPYSGNTIVLNERNHTWFCVYKQMAFERSQVSQAFHREMLTGAPVERNCWDSCAYFQKSLRDQGLRFDYLQGRFRRDFIHYGAFSKNTSVTRETVGLFRIFARAESALPGRAAGPLRRLRLKLLPKLENNRPPLGVTSPPSSESTISFRFLNASVSATPNLPAK